MPRYDDEGNPTYADGTRKPTDTDTEKHARFLKYFAQMTPAEQAEYLAEQSAAPTAPTSNKPAPTKPAPIIVTDRSAAQTKRKLAAQRRGNNRYGKRIKPDIDGLRDYVLPHALKSLLTSLIAKPHGLRETWFLLLTLNENAAPPNKLTDEDLTQFINILFPPNLYPSDYARNPQRFRKLYNAANPTSKQSYAYRYFSRYTHPAPLPPHQPHTRGPIPNPPHKIPILYRTIPRGRYGSPIAQIHPPRSKVIPLLPHKYRRADTPPTSGGFFPENLS